MATQIQATPIITGEKAKEIEKLIQKEFAEEDIERGKANLRALFQDKEQYYKLSTLYGLAYEDDVNGNCDGKADVGVVACLTSADVEPVRHGEWICKTNEHNYFEFHCSLCGRIEEKEEPYCHCGAKMDGGN